jgi:hypothetical protein
MAAKPKQKKKKLTLDDFAVAIQADIARMATNQDLKNLAGDMARGFKEVHGALRDIRDDVKAATDAMVSKADLAETLRTELNKSPFAKEKDVAELRERVLRVEEHLGMKPGRHSGR